MRKTYVKNTLKPYSRTQKKTSINEYGNYVSE